MYQLKIAHGSDVGQRSDSSLNTTSIKPNVEVPLTEAGLTPSQEELLDGIGIVTLCDRPTLLYIANQWPGLLDMTPASMTQHLLDLKAAMPGA